jgi:DNA modification methylase
MLTNEPKIEMVATSALIPYARNAKRHDDAQVAKLAGSIREYGFTNPVLIDADNGIIAGHGRVLGAQKLGLVEVPCIRLSHLTETQRRAYVLADNRLAEIGGGWDPDMLRIEVEELREAGVDLDGIGLDAEALAELVPPPDESNEGNGEPDEIPEPPVDPITKAGDLWLLGDHRVLCGDSTKEQDVTRLMNAKKADLLFTDPPYGVDYEGVTNDHLKAEHLRLFIFSVLKNADAVLKAGACFYIWHPDIHAYEFIGAVRDVNWTQAKPAIIQWLKNTLVLSQGDYHLRNEPCLYGWKPGAAHKRVEDRTQDTIWEFPKPSRSLQHPTMKPVALCSRAIINSSENNWIVSDPFLGSGTTLIAAEQLNRKCYGLEISPAYCDVIVQRWQTFTGKEAVNEATGLTFAATKAKMEGP